MIDQFGKFYIKNIFIWKFELIGSSCWLFGANGQVVDPPIINIFIYISASQWVVLTILIRIWETNKNNSSWPSWTEIKTDEIVKAQGPRSRPNGGYWKLIRSRDCLTDWLCSGVAGRGPGCRAGWRSGALSHRQPRLPSLCLLHTRPLTSRGKYPHPHPHRY